MFTIKEPQVSDFSTGYGSITCKVNGFWSTDTITARIRRDFCEGNWDIQMCHSSGGRDSKEVECDLEAETNYGYALVAVAAFAKQWFKDNKDALEKAYIDYREDCRRMREEEEMRKKEKLEKDPPIGLEKAKNMVNQLFKAAKEEAATYMHSAIVKRFYPRAGNSTICILVERLYDSRTVIKVKDGLTLGDRFVHISKKNAIEMIANFSQREYVEEVTA